MSIGIFADKNHRPTQSEIISALGASHPWWELLVTFLQESYQLPGELTYGGKNYGWNLWYKRSRSLISLYPQAEGITVQIVLGKAELEKALSFPLGEHFSKVLRETPLLHDGLWMFVPLQSNQDVEDVKNLLLIKSRPRKKKS